MQQLFGMVDWFSGPDLQNSATSILLLLSSKIRRNYQRIGRQKYTWNEKNLMIILIDYYNFLII